MKPTDIVVYTVTEDELACGTVTNIDDNSGMLRVTNAGITRLVHVSRIVLTGENKQSPSDRQYYHQVMRSIG